MTVEQISVFVENRSGQLGDVTRVLEAAGINIRALSLSDTTDFGVLRLMADDTQKAKAALAAAGFTVGSTPVVAVDVEDTPGGLGRVLRVLSEHGINVEYLYAYTQRESTRATIIFRFDRTEEAVNVLQQYAKLAKQGVRGENAASIRAEVEHNAASIATAFENQLDALYAAESMDLSADLTVLQNMLKGQGL